jgi:putative ABC transport system ATP-binding protein
LQRSRTSQAGDPPIRAALGRDAPEPPPGPAGSSALLTATGVTRTYRQGSQPVVAVRGVDLDLTTGEFVAIVGPSGSGKSTLLHILSGLDRPDAGAVRLDGRVISTLPERELAVVRRRRFGFVLQFYNLLPTLSALENVAFPLLLDSVRDAGDRARTYLDRVGLGHRATHRPDQLSGGEQQRVALARALVSRPGVVFADEPTGNLDTTTGREILGLLRETADAGQAILLVTHDPDVAAYADRVVTMVDGQVRVRPAGAAAGE